MYKWFLGHCHDKGVSRHIFLSAFPALFLINDLLSYNKGFMKSKL